MHNIVCFFLLLATWLYIMVYQIILKYFQAKRKLEEIEKKRKGSSYEVNRLTDLFANFAEKLNDLKENNERDSGKHHTPLLTQIFE